MKVTDFINKLKHIASLPTTYYSVAGGNWAKWNGRSWNFDCVILIKAVLWGWSENKNHAHGGAVYGSNGVYDDSADGIINHCKNVSSNFKSIQAGELLHMPGHVGIYIGNGQVIECTAAWEAKVLYSKIDDNGNRSRNGVYAGRWLKHGKLPYLEYVNANSNNSTSNTNKNKNDKNIKVGNKVKVLKAIQYNGQPFATYYKEYDVIEVKGERVVIGKGKTVTCAINIKNIQKI